MIGLVLAAGAGRRLHPLTDALPKTLLEVRPDRTILDVAVANLRAVGLDDVVVVVGFAADRIAERVPALQRRHGVRVELLHNDRAQEWNNAYSLWLARDVLAEGALLVNGDTVHPPTVEEALLGARGPGVLLALDADKRLGEEEMKVVLAPDGGVRRISKLIEPAAADGEYLGVTLVESAAAGALTTALEATWQADPSQYYEDGFQLLADRGGEVGVARLGALEWVEVDCPADLDRARRIAAGWG